jgi:hypothetical protein
MPNWQATTPQDDLTEAIGKALKDLDLTGDPSFDQVLGLSFDRITKHAMEAISVLVQSNQLDLNDPTTLIQIYVLGFVVGTKYGEKRAQP